MNEDDAFLAVMLLILSPIFLTGIAIAVYEMAGLVSDIIDYYKTRPNRAVSAATNEEPFNPYITL